MTATAAQVRRFAYRQGPGRTLLDAPVVVDGDAVTTSTLPPTAARGGQGHMLTLDHRAVLDRAAFPAWPVMAQDRLGHVLLAAFGLQRREPSNPFNDHRAIASVRSKFPVHVFTVSAQGPAAYLDVYRHALVDLDLDLDRDPSASGSAEADPVAALRPRAGATTVVLASRYTDLPTAYARLRGALAELELGVNLRSLFSAADLFGVAARLDPSGVSARRAERLVRAAGPGAWSPPVVIELDCADLGPLTCLPAAGPVPRSADVLLANQAAHWSVDEVSRIAEPAYALAAAPALAAHGLPDLDPAGRTAPSWAQVLWRRGAGRAPRGISGFTVKPCRVDAACVADLVAYASVPAPTSLMREIADTVQLSVALQGAGDLPTGVYRLVDGALGLVREDPSIMTQIQRRFGYPLSPLGACGIGHATAVWVLSADVAMIIDRFGPAAWVLLQRWCGWVSHGLCVASAAHGLFARPARSFDEFALRSLMDLPTGQMPVFFTVCGRTRFGEPLLDLRI